MKKDRFKVIMDMIQEQVKESRKKEMLASIREIIDDITELFMHQFPNSNYEDAIVECMNIGQQYIERFLEMQSNLASAFKDCFLSKVSEKDKKGEECQLQH